MRNLNETPSDSNFVHLLLIAPSKTGKSTYAAEAAIDGFNLIYIDADNGLSALVNRIGKEKNAEEIRKRVNYMGTTRPRQFVSSFLRSNTIKPLLWAERLDKPWSANMADMQPDDSVFVLDITSVPANYLLVIDSWTSLCQDALQQLRPEQKAPLLEGVDQSIYGEAKSGVDFICNIMQMLRLHVMVQAHDTRYEIYEKPKNQTAAETKQRDMTLIDTLQVPIGTSRISGLEMAKRFNHIGWLEVSPNGMVDIDFTRHPKRVSGGPPNRKARTTDLSFLKVVTEAGGFLPTDPIPAGATPWFQIRTHAQLVESKGKVP